MAAECGERDSGRMFESYESCSVCLDLVNDSGERSIAKLKCGHHFHLDCIGSAFNAKGAMQCPNCRHVENGQWLYANGSRWSSDFTIEEIPYGDDDYEVYNSLPNMFMGSDTINHLEWCPFQELQAGGSSHPEFRFSLGERDDLGFLPEVVVNVSYNYNENRGATSTPPVCPYLDTQNRQAQGSEDSRVHSPVEDTRPRNPSGAIGGPLGSIIGDGDLFTSQSNIWTPRREGLGVSPGFRANTSSFADQYRSSPRLEFPFVTSRSGTTFYGDTGSGPSAYERPTHPWTRTETERANSQSIYSAQVGHNESYIAEGGSLPVGPCPRPRFAHGQDQSQSQSSSLRSAPIGSNRRSRHSAMAASLTSGGGRTERSHTTGEPSRRFGHSWTDLSSGPEPPVPGMESSHGGPIYGRDFVPPPPFVPWRTDNTLGPSNSLWTPGQLWHPPPRTSTGLQQSSFRYSDFIDGHGSSQPQSDLEQYQTSLFSSFGQEGAPVSSIPYPIHLQQSHSIPLGPR